MYKKIGGDSIDLFFSLSSLAKNRYDKNDEISDRKLIDTILPFLTENAKSKKYMMERAILTTKNEHVNELNAKMIKIFPGINIHIS